MVHALELSWQLLKSDGILIEIHPVGKPPPIEALIGPNRFGLGSLQETDDFIEYFQAEEAVEQIIRRSLFRIERQREYEFIIRATSLAELKSYLLDNWSDAILSPEIETRAVKFLERSDSQDRLGAGKSIQIRETVKITRLVKLATVL